MSKQDILHVEAVLRSRSPSIDKASISSKDGSRVEEVQPNAEPLVAQVPYRLYKRRFLGIVGLIFLNIIAAMPWPWFGPISNNVADDFGFSLTKVNWLGNIVSLVFLPVALAVPTIISRHGLRRCCDIGAVFLIVSAWIRYAGTARSLSPGGSYALLFFGQLIAGVAQPIFQVIGPKYSELWFDLKGRTTATMLIAISNPIGAAIGQLLSPIVGDSRFSILILGILCTAVTPLVFMVGDAPPSPPTYAGSKSSPPLMSLIYALAGKETTADARMTVRERKDFSILFIVFGILVAAGNAFAILTSQILTPVGYSSTIAGLLGACLLLPGIVAAIITAPLFDRVFTHHLAVSAKVLVPLVGVGWFSLIWAVRPNNTGALFAVVSVIGICSITMLPVGLELACEMTRNADGSSALLWFAGNLLGVVFVLIEGALPASENANPPLNMKRALIFSGVVVLTGALTILLLDGKQTRKEIDEQKIQEQAQLAAEMTPTA